MIYVIPFGCSLSVGQQVAYVKLLRVVPKALEVVVFALILLKQVDEHAAEVEQNPAGRASLNVLGCCAERTENIRMSTKSESFRNSR